MIASSLAFDQVFAALASAVLAVLVVSAAAWWIARMLWRRQPALRHAVLGATLACAAVAPLIALGLAAQGIQLIRIPTAAPADFNELATSSIDPLDHEVLVEPLSTPHDAEDSQQSPNTTRTATTASPPQPTRMSPRRWASSWRVIVLALWSTGTLFCLWPLARGVRLARRLRRQARLVEAGRRARWLAGLDGRPAEYPAIAEAPSPTPLLLGVWRPLVVLPWGLAERLTAAQLRDVLIHERAHCQRRDNLRLLGEAILRALYWPLPTIHLALQELAVTREELCDNAVLADRDRVDYGETLLRIAELATSIGRLPLASGVVRSPGALERRVTGLLDARRSVATRAGRPLAVLFSTLLLAAHVPLCGLGLVAQDAQQDSEQAEIATLLDGLDATRQAIHNLEVSTDYTKQQLLLLPVKEPVRLQVKMRAVVDDQGRSRNEVTGEQVAITAGGKAVRIHRMRSIGAFDGQAARSMQAYEDQEFSSGAIDTALSWHGVDPREYTTHFQHEPVVDRLRQRGAHLAERVEWDGRRVVVVETTPNNLQDGEQRKYRFWIDPERRIVVRRAIVVRYRPDQPWQEYARIESRDHRELAPGIWLPMHVLYESLTVTAKVEPEKLAWSYDGTNHDWKVNQTLPDSTFVIEFPSQIRVNDHRPPEPAKPEPAKPELVKPAAPGAATAARDPLGTLTEPQRELLQRIADARPRPFGKSRSYGVDDAGNIVSLHFAEAVLRPADIEVLATFTSARQLDLQKSNIQDGDLRQLRSLYELRTLNLADTKIGDAGLAQLTGWRQLSELQLTSTLVTDEGLPALAALPNLRTLSLRYTAIGDAGAEHLAQLASLVTLKLGDTKVTDVGLRHLIALPKLHGLTLDETKVTDAGLAELARRDGFGWIARPELTAQEFSARQALGDSLGVLAMHATGPDLPTQGQFTSRVVLPLPRSARDERLGRTRFRIEWDWNIEGRPQDRGLFAVIGVLQGAVQVHEVGLIQE